MVSMIFSSFSMVTEFNCLAVEFEGLCPSPAIGPYDSSLKKLNPHAKMYILCFK